MSTMVLPLLLLLVLSKGSTENALVVPLCTLSELSGIFSSLTPAMDEVLIASFLFVRRVLVFVFLTSYSSSVLF